MENEEKGFTFLGSTPDSHAMPEGGLSFLTEDQVNRPQMSGSEIASDVGKTALAKGAQGLAGTVLGGPASVLSFMGKDVPEAVRNTYNRGLETFDVISPDEREARNAQPNILFAGPQNEEQQKGLMSPWNKDTPTYKGVVETVKRRAPELGAPVLAYEPVSDVAKTVGSGVEMATQGVPGAVRTAPSRMLTNFGAGAGSEALGLYNEGEDLEGVARIAGALGGAGAVGGISNVIKSTMLPSGAKDALATALANDLARGGKNSGMTIEQIREAINSGAPMSVYDMAGPETRKLLGRYAEIIPDQEKIRDFNTFLRERAASSSDRVQQTFKMASSGQPVDAVALTKATEAAGQITRDNVYALARAEPAAAAIHPVTIGADLIDRPIMQKAMRDAEINGQNAPQWNIVPPKNTPAVSPTPTGVLDASGQPIMTQGSAAVSTPGNLSYWDQVKRELDAKIKVAKNSGETSDLAALEATRADLVNKLDAIVPAYNRARDIASETFQAASAPEAGYNFVGTTGQFRLRDLKDALAKYTPEQKELFEIGAISRISEMAGTNIKSLTNKMMNDSNFQNSLKMALTENNFNILKGKVLSENIIRNTQEIQFLQTGGMSAKSAGLFTGAASFGTEALLSALAGGSFGSVRGAAIGAGVGAGTAATKYVLSASERNLARKVLPLAMSQKPSDIAEFGKLVSGASNINRLFNKINNALAVAVQGAQRTYASKEGEQRPGHARGGKVGHQHLVDRLMRMAEQAKKASNASTEPLLNAPDEAVIKALDIAQRHI